MANTPNLDKIKRNSIIVLVVIIGLVYGYSAWTRLQYANYLEKRNESLFDYNHYISSIEDVLLNEGFSEDGISTLNFYATSTLENMLSEDDNLPTTVLSPSLYSLGVENRKSDQEALEMHRELESYIVEYRDVYEQINLVSSFRACIADIDLDGINSTVASASINSCLGEFNIGGVEQEDLAEFASRLRSYWSLSSELYRRDGTTENVTALSKKVKSTQLALITAQNRWEANKEIVLNISEVEEILSTQ